jgi:predicted transcriptional regulator YdeE
MTAQIVNIEKDMEVLCVTASSFPEGVKDAFDTLHNKFPSSEDRTFYGISYQSQDGHIVYKAAISVVENKEAEKYQCETFLIKKGQYISETITDFMNNIPLIGQTFQNLLTDPRVNKESGYCLERYINQNDLQCMVTLVS